MQNTTKKRLFDALSACQAIQGFVAGRSFDDYQASLIMRSAVERQFEIVGEALSQASVAEPDLASAIPELRRIVGLRNRIIHGYDSVDDELLWQVAQTYVPTLARQLEVMLAE